MADDFDDIVEGMNFTKAMKKKDPKERDELIADELEKGDWASQVILEHNGYFEVDSVEIRGKVDEVSDGVLVNVAIHFTVTKELGGCPDVTRTSQNTAYCILRIMKDGRYKVERDGDDDDSDFDDEDEEEFDIYVDDDE